MADYQLMPAAEIAEGTCRLVTVNGVDIGIFRTLAQGPQTGWQPRWEREGEILYCPWHGSDFDLCTGRALSRKPLRLKSYPVRVENGTVTITV